MQPQSNPPVPRFNAKTVLAWIGGFALAIWAVQLVTSLEFWRVVLWPVAWLMTIANVRPEDIKPGDLLMGFLVASIAVCGLATMILLGIQGLRKKSAH
jgi:hypothetical protein